MGHWNHKPGLAAARAAGATSPITTAGHAPTHEGAPGFARTPASELFLLAVTDMAGQNTHYETAEVRGKRLADLAQTVAVADPAWMAGFIPWLRNSAHMRSASVVVACEAVKGRLDAGGDNSDGHNRRFIRDACARADEPGEILAYWTSHHGRAIPKPVKNGVADAVRRLYTERALVKYDSQAAGFRFGDVIELVHPSPDPAKPWQGDLFRHALDRSHGRDTTIPASLQMLHRREWLLNLPLQSRRTLLSEPGADRLLNQAGMTWEALSSWLQGPMDAAAWQAIIPSMGYMALLRNLSNLDKAKISNAIAQSVANRLADPDEVSRSRQLPMRFLSAYKAAGHNLRWGAALEQALANSLANIPSLPGRTLIMVDTSTSMREAMSDNSEMARWHAAALFGIALAIRCDAADVVSYSSTQQYTNQAPGAYTKHFTILPGESVLRSLDRWANGGFFLGGGTETAAALRKEYRSHDRVIVLTDEQSTDAGIAASVDRSIPTNIPMYTANLAGYKAGHAPAGTAHRHAFGGLTDEMFRVIPLLESHRGTTWPWETGTTG